VHRPLRSVDSAAHWGSIYHPRLTAEMMRQGRRYLNMDGRLGFKHAVERFQEVIHEALQANQLHIEDVNWLNLHQANLRISEALTEALRVPDEKVFNTIQRCGNTSAPYPLRHFTM
jgi:3-oxoacyl-[acyl-carrier-protein] synthase III